MYTKAKHWTKWVMFSVGTCWKIAWLLGSLLDDSQRPSQGPLLGFSFYPNCDTWTEK